MTSYLVSALYKFVKLDDFSQIAEEVRSAGLELQIQGKLILSREGINGTIAGIPENVRRMVATIRHTPSLSDVEAKESYTHDLAPFPGFRVLLRDEIVTMGEPSADPLARTGEYVSPEEWNGLVDDPEVVVIDTRNTYEVHVGTFQGAIQPHTETFRAFPEWVNAQAESLRPETKIAMFCTGGIRCERASSYLLSRGFQQVYQLHGGVLNYLEKVPEEESRWVGECFVFDGRVSVDHNLNPGQFSRCGGCRHPLSPEETQSDEYEKGVSCPHCIHEITEAQKSRFRERKRQMMLAEARGESHLFENTGCDRKHSSGAAD